MPRMRFWSLEFFRLAIIVLLVISAVYLGVHSAGAQAAQPRFAVNPGQNSIQGYDWTVGATLTIAVNGGTVLTHTVAPGEVDQQGNIYFSLSLPAALQPNDVVSVTDGSVSKTLTITPLSVQSFNLAANTLSGTAGPNDEIALDILSQSSDTPLHLTAAAGADGNWLADLSGLPNPRAAVSALISVTDEDGDATQAAFNFPNPIIQADPQAGLVKAIAWPVSGPVALQIDDLSNSTGMDYTDQQVPDQNGTGSYGDAVFTLKDFTLKPGQLITITGGGVTHKLLVTGLSVTYANIATDVVYGQTDSNLPVYVYSDACGPQLCTFRKVSPNGNNWITDFSQPGSGTGQAGRYSITVGSQLTLVQQDSDGDQTRIQYTVPWMAAYADIAQDQISGSSWDIGSQVNLEVDDPATPQNPDYTSSAAAQSTSLSPVFNLKGILQLRPGFTVRLSGLGVIKTLVVSGASIREINPDDDTVSGIATPGQHIRVGPVCNRSGCATRETTAAADGGWQVSFADPGGGPLLDLREGDCVTAYDLDEDADATVASRCLPNPHISADLSSNKVLGYDWPSGTVVSISINAVGNAAGGDFNDQARALPVPDNPDSTLATFQVSGYKLKAGDTLLLSGGNITRKLTVANLVVSKVDWQNDVISGSADAGSQVEIGPLCDSRACTIRRVSADADGKWNADFSAPGSSPDEKDPLDIIPGAKGEARQVDDSGSSTSTTWSASNPILVASITDNEVRGYDWPLIYPVKLTLRLPGGTTFSDVQTPEPVDGNPGSTLVRFPLSSYTLSEGAVVILEDGALSRTHTVTGLGPASADPWAETVSGSAAPGSVVQVGPLCTDTACAIRHITAGADGTWLADFSKPGQGADEQSLFDIQPGATGEARQTDESGDATSVQWRALNPRLVANPRLDQVSGIDWTAGSVVTLKINGRQPVTAQVKPSPDNLRSTTVDFDLNGFNLKPGDRLSASDGHITSQLTVTSLTITGADATRDVVTGNATPGAQVKVWIDSGSGQVVRRVTADAQGSWAADFSTPGGSSAEEQPIVDLLPGTQGQAEEYNGAGDSTRLQWHVPNPRVEVWPQTGSIVAFDWPENANLRVEVLPQDTAPASTTHIMESVLPEQAEQTEARLNLDYALKAGDRVRVTYAALERVVSLTRLQVTGADSHTDLVSGVAAPNSAVQLSIGKDEQCAFSVTAGSDGAWKAHTTDHGPTCDVQPRMQGFARQLDADGNATVWDIVPPNPLIAVYPDSGRIEALDWPLGANVKITVDDPDVPGAPDFTDQKTTAAQADIPVPVAAFDLKGFSLKPGQTITATDGVDTKILVIAPLEATSYPATDKVSGTTRPNTGVLVWVNASAERLERRVTSDSNGKFTADFSTPSQDNHGGVAQITFDTSGGVAVGDEDTDQTRLLWQVPNPVVHAVLSYPEIHSHGGWGSRTVRLIIHQDANPYEDTPLLAMSKSSADSTWCGEPCFDLKAAHFNLKPGQYVTLTDGIVTKTIQVTDLQVTQVDYIANVVRGKAAPGAQVRVEILSKGSTARQVTADNGGSWVADFSRPGKAAFEQNTADISDGDQGQAMQVLPGSPGDGTLVYWQAVIPACVPGSSVSGHVSKTGTLREQGADLNAPITVTFIDYRSGEMLAKAIPGADGSYGCQLPAGEYRVYAESAGYSREYFKSAYFDQAEKVKVTASSSVKNVDFSLDKPDFAYDQITFNFANPILSDLAVRQAIAYGINREEIISQLMPYSPVLDSITPPGFALYPAEGSSLPHYVYDPARARSLLAAAGWVDEKGSGVREKNGQRLHLVLATTDAPLDTKTANYVADDLAGIGIQVEVKPYPAQPDFLGPSGILKSGQFDLALFGYHFGLNAEYNGYLYHQYDPPNYTENYGHYKNPQADALLDQADALPSDAQRIPLWQQHQVLIMNDLATLPLFWKVESDSDLDGKADLADSCPDDPKNTCSPGGSGAGVIGELGGSVTSANGMVRLDIPAGALKNHTLLTITQLAYTSERTGGQGSVLPATVYRLEPGNLVFNLPVTITIKWEDTNNAGIVDGTTMQAAHLVLAKDQTIITPPCDSNPGCSLTDHTLKVAVTSFSTFTLGVEEPTADAGGPYTAQEGLPVTLNASNSTNPLPSSLIYEWDLNSDGMFNDALGPTATVTFADQGDYPVAVRVTNADGAAATAATQLTVSNAPPVISSIFGPPNPVVTNRRISISASFKDTGLIDTHHAIWNWADGQTSTAFLSEANGMGQAGGAHAFTNPGIYRVVLTLRDRDGGVAQSVYAYVVAYDPVGSTLAGQGEIDSRQGAYTADSSRTGRANFGLLARLPAGKSSASGGNVIFDFSLGDLTFHADRYASLVVQGSRVQIQGTGTVNGRGDYSFNLTVLDGSSLAIQGADSFRLRIWSSGANGEEQVIYDNQPDAQPNALPDTYLSEGAIRLIW